MVSTARRALLVSLCGATLAACGFKLRGPIELPFSSLYINVPPNTRFGAQLRRYIQAASPSVRIVERPGDAEVQLQILDVERDRREIALTAQGRVQEYELTLRLTFQVIDARGELVVPPTTLTAMRSLPYDDNVAQAKEAEAEMLYENMQANLTQRIVNRLGSIETRIATEEVVRQEQNGNR